MSRCGEPVHTVLWPFNRCPHWGARISARPDWTKRNLIYPGRAWQDFPHITLAIGRDADGRRHPANHALEMLSAGQGSAIPLDPPVTLKGIVSRHYWEPSPKRGRPQRQ
jgi:hypothetical protein